MEAMRSAPIAYLWSAVSCRLPTHHRPHQDITACESEATKKGVQVGAAQKQLEKLGKEATKNQAEKEKMEAQRDKTMQVRWRGPCWWTPSLGLGAAEAGRQQAKLVIACSSSLPQCLAAPAVTPATTLPPSAPTPPPPAGQEFKALEDAAFQVCAAVEQIKAQLAGKEEELGATRAEYDKKKKEVSWGWAGGPCWWSFCGRAGVAG